MSQTKMEQAVMLAKQGHNTRTIAEIMGYTGPDATKKATNLIYNAKKLGLILESQINRMHYNKAQRV